MKNVQKCNGCSKLNRNTEKHHKTRGSTLISGFFEIHIVTCRHIDQFAQRIFLALENSLSKYNINTNLQLGKNGFYPVDTSFEWRCLFDDESMWRLLDKLPHLKFSGTAKQLTTKLEREMEEWSEFTTCSTSRRTLTLELVCCVRCVNFHKSNAWKWINWH